MNNQFPGLEPVQNALDYDSYVQTTHQYLISHNQFELDDKEKILYEYKKLNAFRSQRINRTLRIDEELKQLINGIHSTQSWFVITEDWCGDSAQNLPYIVEMSKLNSNINLGILQRDANLDIMDKYLTNGKRSIPKLIAFNENGTELFQWGPKPNEAESLIERWKSEGMEKSEYTEKLHLWYTKNKGINLQIEFKEILKKILFEV